MVLQHLHNDFLISFYEKDDQRRGGLKVEIIFIVCIERLILKTFAGVSTTWKAFII